MRATIDFETSALLEAANGFLALEMWEEARECTEELEPQLRAHPASMRIRLKAATGLKIWDMGAMIADYFGTEGSPKDCEAVGRFRLAYARALISMGSWEGARREIGELAKVWPEGRVRVLDEPALSELL